jgi:hypothetical protein
MAKAGYTLREAQEELGHSHATMTDRYTHLFPFPSDAEARVTRLDDLLEEPVFFVGGGAISGDTKIPRKRFSQSQLEFTHGSC